MGNNLKISAIIRTKNEDQWIGHCIQSLLDNFDKPEILIIDNNSKDQTIEIVNEFKEDKSLKSIDNRYTTIKTFEIPKYSPGSALNLGVAKSSNENILIISAHCVINSIDKEKLLKTSKIINVFLVIKYLFTEEKKYENVISGQISKINPVKIYSQTKKIDIFYIMLLLFIAKISYENPFDENLSGKKQILGQFDN